jgi:hypothetical protein
MLYGYLEYINSLQALRPQYDAAKAHSEFDSQYDRSLNRLLNDIGDKFDGAFTNYNIKDGSTQGPPNQPPQPTVPPNSVSGGSVVSAGRPGG